MSTFLQVLVVVPLTAVGIAWLTTRPWWWEPVAEWCVPASALSWADLHVLPEWQIEAPSEISINFHRNLRGPSDVLFTLPEGCRPRPPDGWFTFDTQPVMRVPAIGSVIEVTTTGRGRTQAIVERVDYDGTLHLRYVP